MAGTSAGSGSRAKEKVRWGDRWRRRKSRCSYSRALDPYWNLQGGVRYDLRPNPSRAYAVLKVGGLAPSFFDVEGALFLSNKGAVRS